MSSPGLKRPLELEQHLNTNFTGLKRRCGAGGAMHQQPNQYQQQQQQLHLQQHQFAQQQNSTNQHYHPQPQHNLTSSPFKSSILAPLGEEVARVIKDEIINNQSQQQQHRDQQHQHQQQQQQQQQHQQQQSPHQQHPHQSNHHHVAGHSQQHQTHQQDPPVLTIRQTQIICEKLIKDREQKLREEYDRILMSKLAEQYETFVKYTHDHLEKPNSQHQASYLS